MTDSRSLFSSPADRDEAMRCFAFLRELAVPGRKFRFFYGVDGLRVFETFSGTGRVLSRYVYTNSLSVACLTLSTGTLDQQKKLCLSVSRFRPDAERHVAPRVPFFEYVFDMLTPGSLAQGRARVYLNRAHTLEGVPRSEARAFFDEQVCG